METLISSFCRSKFKFSYSKLMHVSLEPYHLGKYLIDEEDRERNRYLKKWLHATLQNFFASDDDELSMELHVPHLSELRRTENENYIVDPNERKQVIWKYVPVFNSFDIHVGF